MQPLIRWIHLLLLGIVAVLSGCSGPSVNRPPAPASASSAAQPAPAATGELFDGTTLRGWMVTDFAGGGAVTVTNREIHLGMGYMTGIHWTSSVPRMNYEISLEAMRVDGSDFFCGLTFPVGSNYCSFIVGGWGGGVVGLSSIDGDDASQNETTHFMNFESGKWYAVRVRVTPGRIQAWVDNERIANVETEERRLSIRLEVEQSTPLGISTWNTAAALRNIRVKSVSEP